MSDGIVDEQRMRRAIACKRDGGALDDDLWRDIIAGYLSGNVAEASLAALLMACVLRGMTRDEARALTAAFVASGETLPPAAPAVLDKHSSGGVGDSASLIVVPLVAACGVPVAKLSGRALGHTGGTLDKLEAVPGVRTDLEPERFAQQVRTVGCAIAAQSARLVPADKRVYALRDRTATVPSRGLIAASIVSKKIAGGATAIAYDVKAGRGAFMPDPPSARDLADLLVDVTRSFGRNATALVSDMNEPLGRAIGSGIETIEARDVLRGSVADARLLELCETLAIAMLRLAGASGDLRARVRQARESGAAAETFERMLRAQGAHSGALGALAVPDARTDVVASASGTLAGVDAVALGETARGLTERYGPTAGIVVRRRIGERIAAGDVLATLYGPQEDDARAVGAAFELGEPPPARPVVYEETGAGSGVASVEGGALTGSVPRSSVETR